MADEKPESSPRPSVTPVAPQTADATLGQYLAQTRQSRGFTPEAVVAATRIPAHYVRAIESDNYASVSDELYLLPFLRRYAVFVGLDPEDVAARFVREVQRAENSSAPRLAEPISMVTSTRERKPARGHGLGIALLIIAVAILAIAVYLRRDLIVERVRTLTGIATPIASPAPSAAATSGSASASSAATAAPLKTVITPAAPAASPSADPGQFSP